MSSTMHTLSFLILLITYAGNSLGNDYDYVDYYDENNLGIVNGEDADIADYPYMLGLSYSKRIFCGAALISPKWALTTAICTFNLNSPEEVVVLANSSYWNTSLEVNVSRIIDNPDFDFITFDNDISLLELSSPLDCDNCQPISLSSKRPHLGQFGTLTGWGWTVQLGNLSDVLQVLHDVPIVNRTICEDTYHLKKDVSENMFCAGYYIFNVTKDFCQSDIGGPFVVEGALAGLAAWGYGCSDSIYPGVYTAVANYLDWITEYVDEISIV